MGKFSGLPKTVWSDDGRSMHLLEDFSYTDKIGKVWTAPTGAWLDGASIPYPFWILVDSPFTGHARKPSIIHDHYCRTKSEDWKSTHRMFFEACLDSGLSPIKAKTMYMGVYHYGPRWIDGRPIMATLQASSDDVKRIVEFVEKFNPSIEEIENQ